MGRSGFYDSPIRKNAYQPAIRRISKQDLGNHPSLVYPSLISLSESHHYGLPERSQRTEVRFAQCLLLASRPPEGGRISRQNQSNHDFLRSVSCEELDSSPLRNPPRLSTRRAGFSSLTCLGTLEAILEAELDPVLQAHLQLAADPVCVVCAGSSLLSLLSSLFSLLSSHFSLTFSLPPSLSQAPLFESLSL